MVLALGGERYYATVKADGASATVYKHDGHFRLFAAVKHLIAKVGYVPKKIIKGSGGRKAGHLVVGGNGEWVVHP
ncbi:MAG: hypothetical protein QW734_09590, partial [Candidatus Bathyarchaeia archaeon]